MSMMTKRAIVWQLADAIGLMPVTGFCQDGQDHIITLRDVATEISAIANCKEMNFMDFFDYDQLLDFLFNEIESFMVCACGTVYRDFKNPYLGCKSLEEALILKDMCFSHHDEEGKRRETDGSSK